jgi:hypothetical protein
LIEPPPSGVSELSDAGGVGVLAGRETTVAGELVDRSCALRSPIVGRPLRARCAARVI